MTTTTTTLQLLELLQVQLLKLRELQLQIHFNYTTTTTATLQLQQHQSHYSYNFNCSCTTPHYIQELWVRWPLQPLQPPQKAQLQPPFGPSVDSLCHPCTQQFTSPIVSYPWNFRRRLVWHYWYLWQYDAIDFHPRLDVNMHLCMWKHIN